MLASVLLGTAAMYWLARSHALGAAAPSWSIAELVAGIRQWCWAGVSLLTHPANFIGTGLVAASFPLFWADSKRMIEAQRRARPRRRPAVGNTRRAVDIGGPVLLFCRGQSRRWRLA